MLIDLQLHSDYSDGSLKPSQVAAFIARQGVKVASLTDHNTIDGWTEFAAACRQHKIKAIKGLELYVKVGRRMSSLLWFNFDDTYPELQALLKDTHTRRMSKARTILASLNKAGYHINIEKTLGKFQRYLSLNHLQEDIISIPHNYKKLQKEIGEKHLREGEMMKELFFNKKIGLFHNSYVSIERVASLRQKIGGQLILNHPGKYGFLKLDVIHRLKSAGVDGLEVLSPHHSVGAVMHAQHIAHELDWIMTGGSDFHRYEGSGQLLQDSWQYFKIDSKLLNGVERIID